jgi:hypothetical protein
MWNAAHTQALLLHVIADTHICTLQGGGALPDDDGLDSYLAGNKRQRTDNSPGMISHYFYY